MQFFHKSAPLGSRNCQTVGSEYAYYRPVWTYELLYLVSYYEMLDCLWEQEKKRLSLRRHAVGRLYI